MTTFSDLIQSRQQHDVVVIHDREVWSAERLLVTFRSLRSKLYGLDVAVFIRDVGTAVSVLAAIDGWVQSILIIPTSTSPAQLNLILGSNSKFVLVTDLVDVGVANGVVYVDDWRLTCPQSVETELASTLTTWKLLTSGTTGTPKTAIHSLVSLVQTAKPPSTLSRGFVWGLTYEWSRFAGLQVVLQSVIGDSVLMAPRYGSDVSQSISYFIEYGCTHVSATPSYWRRALMTDGVRNLPLIQATLGGEIVDDTVLSNIHKSFPDVRVSHVYAATEIGVGFAVTDGRAGFPSSYLEKLINNWIFKVVDNRLLVRSGSSSCFSRTNHEWVDTGDRVSVVGDRVYFLGRSNGIINVGGNKVLPEEVEQVILELPYVLSVRVSAVSSSIVGALVKAEVVVDSSYTLNDEVAPSIREYVSKRLDRYKVPALVKIVDEIEVGASGKISRL